MGEITVIGVDYLNLKKYSKNENNILENKIFYSNIKENTFLEKYYKININSQNKNDNEKLRDNILNASKNENVILFVEGSPFFREEIVKLLLEEKDIEIYDSRSISEIILSRLKYISDGYNEVDSNKLFLSEVDLHKDLFIYNLEEEKVFEKVVKFLKSVYEKDDEIIFIKDLGLDSEEIKSFSIDELKTDLKTNSKSTLFVKRTDKKDDIKDLLNTGRILRSENGCPWDREQNYDSLKGDLIEEAYEVIDAIENKDIKSLSEELGDLLFQVVLYSQIGYENGDFDFIDVTDGINKKLIYRHPHVFNDLSLDKTWKVLQNWDSIKYSKREINTFWQRLDSEKGMPSTIRAENIIDKVTRIGFDWDKPEQVLEKVKEEYYEVVDALENNGNLEEELGDLLFTVCNLSQFLDFEPEILLQNACDKFVGRFKIMEEIAEEENKDIKSVGKDELERLWQISKKY